MSPVAYHPPNYTRVITPPRYRIAQTLDDLSSSTQQWVTWEITQFAPQTQTEACPGVTTCYYIGNDIGLGGVDPTQVYYTTDGQFWNASPMGAGAPDFDVLACANTSTCFIAGGSTVWETSNGAQTGWTSISGDPFTYATALACPTTTTCVIGDGGTTPLAVWSGGSWTSVTSSSHGNTMGISCPGATTCYAMMQDGYVLSTSNLTTWTASTSAVLNGNNSPYDWAGSGISCPSLSECVVIGTEYAGGTYNGALALTTNSGSTWSLDSGFAGLTSPAPAPVQLSGIACPSTTSCQVTQSGSSSFATAIFTGTPGAPGSWTDPTPSSVWSDTAASINAVACGAVNDCFALGYGWSNGVRNPVGNLLALDNAGLVEPTDGPVEPAEEYGGLNQAEPCEACYLRSLGAATADLAGDPVNTEDGDYTEKLPIVSMPTAGLPFGEALTYDAQEVQAQVAGGTGSPGPFGWGWSGSNTMNLVNGPGTNQVTVNQSSGSQVIFQGTTVGSTTTYAPVDSHRVNATLAISGSSYVFTTGVGLAVYDFQETSGSGYGSLQAEYQTVGGPEITFGTESHTSTNACPSTTSYPCLTEMDPGGRDR